MNERIDCQRIDSFKYTNYKDCLIKLIVENQSKVANHYGYKSILNISKDPKVNTLLLKNNNFN